MATDGASCEPDFSRAPEDAAGATSEAAKKDFDVDTLSKSELRMLLSVMEGELEARDLVIEALRACRNVIRDLAVVETTPLYCMCFECPGSDLGGCLQSHLVLEQPGPGRAAPSCTMRLVGALGGSVHMTEEPVFCVIAVLGCPALALQFLVGPEIGPQVFALPGIIRPFLTMSSPSGGWQPPSIAAAGTVAAETVVAAGAGIKEFWLLCTKKAISNTQCSQNQTSKHQVQD